MSQVLSICVYYFRQSPMLLWYNEIVRSSTLCTHALHFMWIENLT